MFPVAGMFSDTNKKKNDKATRIAIPKKDHRKNIAMDK